jgi:hypothetical protein
MFKTFQFIVDNLTSRILLDCDSCFELKKANSFLTGKITMQGS